MLRQKRDLQDSLSRSTHFISNRLSSALLLGWVFDHISYLFVLINNMLISVVAVIVLPLFNWALIIF